MVEKKGGGGRGLYNVTPMMMSSMMSSYSHHPHSVTYSLTPPTLSTCLEALDAFPPILEESNIYF